MLVRLCGFALCLLPLLAAAGECQMKDLKQARARWAAASIASYRYTFWRDPGAWSNAVSPVRVTVAKGKVVAAHTLRYHSRPGPEPDYDVSETGMEDIAGFDTIQGLLDLIQEHLNQPGIAVSRCTFHMELGSPMAYSYSMGNAFDTGVGFSITDLEILQ